jgi:hypothetical protein
MSVMHFDILQVISKNLAEIRTRTSHVRSSLS